MSDTRPGGSDDPLDFLTHQHREVEQIWIQLEAAHGTDDEVQSQLALELIAMLLQHDAIETELIYPALREHGGERGAELATRSLDEHDKVREQLRQVDGKDPRDEQVWSTMSQLVADVNHHVQEEESEVFPLLTEQWDADERAAVCGRMAELVESAPTRR